MKRIPLILAIVFVVMTSTFTATAYADCRGNYFDGDQGVVGSSGTLLVTCYGFGKQEYSIFDGKDYTVIGYFDKSTKLTLSVNGQETSLATPEDIRFFVGRNTTIVAKVKAQPATLNANEGWDPQVVLEATVVVTIEQINPKATEVSAAPDTAENEQAEMINPSTNAPVTRSSDLEVMPINNFRVLQRDFVNPDDPSASVVVYDLIPNAEAANYHPDGDDWRLHGQGPKGWVLLKVEIGEPFFRNVNFITSLGMVDAETLWTNAAILPALDKAATETERKKILRTSLKVRQ